jgi:hypothetical protein
MTEAHGCHMSGAVSAKHYTSQPMIYDGVVHATYTHLHTTAIRYTGG